MYQKDLFEIMNTNLQEIEQEEEWNDYLEDMKTNPYDDPFFVER